MSNGSAILNLCLSEPILNFNDEGKSLFLVRTERPWGNSLVAWLKIDGLSIFTLMLLKKLRIWKAARSTGIKRFQRVVSAHIAVIEHTYR